MASIYKQSMDLQARLDSLSGTTIKPDLMVDLSLSDINNCWDPSDTRVAHSSSAYFVEDGLTNFNEPAQRFGEIVLKGHVPRFTCVRISGRLVVALPFFNATVLGPTQEIEPELVEYELEDYSTTLSVDVPIHRPLYTPIESIGFLMLAA